MTLFKKICPRCSNEKLVEEFSKCKTTYDGLQSACKECKKQDQQKYYYNNQKILLQKNKEYRAKHGYDPKKQKQKNQEYNLKNPDKKKQYYWDNIEERKLYSKEYKIKYPKKQQLYQKQFLEQNPNYVNNYVKNRLKKDLNFKIRYNLRSRINKALKNNLKSYSTLKYLGCVITFYKLYLESLFLPEMNWDNYGKVWEIDHIKALANFDLTKEGEQFKAFNYKNTEPRFITTKIAENLGYKNYIGNRNKQNKTI